MRNNFQQILIIFLVVFILLDIYAFQGVKTAIQNLTPGWRKSISIIFWSITAINSVILITFLFIPFEKIDSIIRNFLLTWLFMNLLVKVILVLFVFIDDLQRLVRLIAAQFTNLSPATPSVNTSPGISRSEFLAKAGLAVAAIPFTGIVYGVIAGAHDYKVRKHKIALKNLPDSFEGLKIVQISDIHSGSFFNRHAVERGIQMILDQKPDVVFFTGDLVNNVASEMQTYKEVFKAIKAPMGVFSVLGNHDYGDYVQWPTLEAKAENLKELYKVHEYMGWDLLINENRTLERNGEKISIVGIENWGARGHFPKYGDLKKAVIGTEDAKVKLLLSHDPSHWDAQVKPYFKDIDIMFAGHTHGMQFGVEIGKIKWSPVKYMYDQWAGLYQDGKQFLYVNRGFGYIGFPGRIGINPEITVIELVKG